MSARGVTIVSASAGSGKTYRLTEDVTRAVTVAGEGRVPLEALVAVTYTRKAHAELSARIRQKLVGAGRFDEAMRLPLAYLGTVHAACLRLLQEFAVDMGLSPRVDVVAEEQEKLLRQALESALSPELRGRLDRLAWRFELRLDSKIRRIDWVTPVGDIMDLARANRVAPVHLPAMATRSADGLLALLRKPEPDAARLDAALAAELQKALDTLTDKSDGTKVTRNAIDTLREADQRLSDGELAWRDWAKLATLETSVVCRDLVAPLRKVAARYEAHPRLHEELRALTEAVFEAAAAGLSGYQVWKERRRVVDYVDMLDRALFLLDNARVRAELARRLQFAVVDEFQDTSPIQLALFVELHKLAGRSVWVGDRKQCIFEYAGADPLLMDAVSAWIERDGGTLDRLDTNYRSRPELVGACCELFAAAFSQYGFSKEEVVVAPKRENEGLQNLPPFGLFRVDASNKEGVASAIAQGVSRMLAIPDATPVIDRVTKQARPVRPGDIAILVATNLEASQVSAALHAYGTRAALAREGLLATPEGTLADSALRWLADSRDSLAAMMIEALTGFAGKDPETWLTERLRQSADVEPDESAGWRKSLETVRASVGLLSPSEALDRVLAALDAVELCARWPDPAQRLANLDALRALAADYEERCAREREAATVAGLLRHFDAMREPTLRRDEMLAADHQHVLVDDDAVTVCTYHKAKGLEWPVVVLSSLDRGERRDAFEVCPESDRAEFDPMGPLEGRWIRYWPWPFGPIKKVPLADAAAQSETGKRVAEREEKERARLLYVGFTRARDHLVLAARVKTTKQGASQLTAWLDGLKDASGAPLLELPLDAKDGSTATVRIRNTTAKATNIAMRVWHTAPNEPTRSTNRAAPLWFARPQIGSGPIRSPYRIVPSSAELGWPELESAVARATLGSAERLPTAIRLEQKGIEHDVLGNAIHAFFAADIEGLLDQERLELARRLLHGVGMTGVVRAESLITAADSFRSWANTKWPGAVWQREIPIDAIVACADGDRRVSGIIDLLLQTGDDCVIIDHKTFPGTTEAAWRARCVEFMPQLVTYADVLGRVEGKRVRACWVHLPVGGGMVEVSIAHPVPAL